MMYWHVSAKPFYLENLSNYCMRIWKSVCFCLGKSPKFWVRLHYPHPPYFMSCGGKKSVGCMHLSTVVIFKGVLDFKLQPHPGAGTLGSGVMMWMPTLQGNYGPNMNDFRYAVIEYTSGQILTNTLLYNLKVTPRFWPLAPPRGRTPVSEVMMRMLTIQGNYSPNINAFWSVVTELLEKL